jgi:phosphopantetheinyl transferase
MESYRAKREYLVSRIALKDAVRSAIATPGGDFAYPIEIYGEHDDKGKLYIRGYGDLSEKVDGLSVSIAHKINVAVSAVSSAPIGIDMEIIEDKTDDFIFAAFTDNEIAMINDSGKAGGDGSEISKKSAAALRFWTAKEAYGKMIGEGLGGNPKRYEISDVDGDVASINGTRIRTFIYADEYIVSYTLN